jgi:uncharacterized protein YfaS (alpha-2-macroglobulin family)
MRWAVELGRSRLQHLLLLCVLVAACMPASSAPPVVAPSGVVAPRAGEAPAERRLEVVFVGPEGNAALNSTPQIVFNQPLRALGAAGDAPALAITIEPALPGAWHWVGARALRFQPELGRLAASTRYRVTIPAGVRSLDGLVLASAKTFQFETPRPEVLRAYPPQDLTDVEPHTPITLGFNQRLELGEIQRRLSLSARIGEQQKPLAFRLRLARDAAGSGEPLRVDVLPEGGLPAHARIELAIAPGLVAAEGPLTSAEPYRLSFETYGPLRVTELGCVTQAINGCEPRAGVRIELSNPVRVDALKRALSVTPGPLRFPGWASDEDTVRSIDLEGRLAPRSRHEISIAPELVDAYGQRLAHRQARTIVVGDFEPRVGLGVRGEVLTAPSPNVVLAALNAPNLELLSKRLSGAELAGYLSAREDKSAFEALLGLPNVDRSVVSGAVSNVPVQRSISPELLLGAGARGALALGWRYQNGRGEPVEEGRLVQVTDLALTAKLSREGSWIWVTSLARAEPVAGATVRVLGNEPRVALAYETDAQGAVFVPPADFTPLLDSYETRSDALLVAEYRGDASFRRVRDFIPTWRVDPHVDFSAGRREYGLLFAERGLYRPGESVLLKGVIRREQGEGNAVVSDRALTLLLQDANGEDVEEYAVRTNAFGTFASELRIPKTAGLGQFRVLAKGLDGGEAQTFVDVAEFRPAEFKVQATAAAATYMRGAKARFLGQADYLYGAPMAGASARYTVSRNPGSFTPPRSEGFSTSDAVYWQDREQASIGSSVLASAEKTLDAHGELGVDVPLELPGQIAPESVRFDVDVTDVSQQQISSSAATLVHPASFYVGVAQLEDWFQSAPSKLEPRLVALTPEGQRVAGRRVVVELLRRRWVVSRVESNGSYETVSKLLDEPRGQCAALTALEPVKCSIDLRESGYYILLATSQDEKGRPARAAIQFYALGAGRPSFADNDQRKLELVANKQRYRVGETARVLVKSPFQRARALLTIERAGVHQARWLTLEGPTPFIDVPIEAGMRPNVYVSLMVLPPAPATGANVPEPGYRLGYTNLVVDPEQRRLQVAIQTRSAGPSGASGALTTSYAPRDIVDATFAVRDAQGRPASAELTVYAVDEGVLSLSGYQVPDPIAVFTQPRPLSVATLETRDALAKVFLPDLGKGSGGDKGDAGGGGGDEARSDFKTSAYFNPSLVTDARGLARVQFPLPDNLTTFRLMAVAVAREDRYGFAASEITVSKQLMARPALPRFLRAGDSLEASVVVSTRDGKPGKVQVDAAFEGITLLGPAQQLIELGANGQGEARFAARADRITTADFGFAISSGAQRDSVRIRREIQSPARLEATAVYGQTEQAEAQALGDLSALRSDIGGLELSLASTALVGLDTAFETLSDYPYACTEQLASRLLPLGPLRELANAHGKPAPANAAAQMETIVAEILKRQWGDGGFQLWPSSLEPQPWLSAYTLWTLAEARKAGVRIPERVFENGRSYLRQYLNSAREQPAFLATAPIVLDVLGGQGEPDQGALAYVFERRAQLPVFARAFLLHAAVASKSGGVVVETLRRELEARVDLRGNQASLQPDEREPHYSLFDSNTRSHALVLWALLAAEPRHVLGAPLASGLLTARRERGWQSTQESGYALLALDSYRRAQEPAAPSFDVSVWFDKERLLQHQFGDESPRSLVQSLPMARLRAAPPEATGRAAPATLVFDKHGSGTLFYEARLRYAPLVPPSDDLERGFFVQKTSRAVPREQLNDALKQVPEVGQQRFAAGDLVLTDLVLIAPAERHYVVIDDPLPAGFEAVDTQLRTTAAGLDISGSYSDDADPDTKSGFSHSWYRQELRDDRALFFVDHMAAGIYHYRYLARATSRGVFVLPPTRAEEMYQPEVFGRTGARVVEIR